MYIYNTQKISSLKWYNFVWIIFWGLLWPWKLTFSEHWMNFSIQFCFLVALIKLHSFTRCLPFNHWWRIKVLPTIFEGCVLNSGKKRKSINSVDSIIWILKTLNSVQTLVADIPEIKLSHWYLVNKSYEKPHSETQTLIVLNKFVCSRNNRLIPF